VITVHHWALTVSTDIKHLAWSWIVNHPIGLIQNTIWFYLWRNQHSRIEHENGNWNRFNGNCFFTLPTTPLMAEYSHSPGLIPSFVIPYWGSGDSEKTEVELLLTRGTPKFISRQWERRIQLKSPCYQGLSCTPLSAASKEAFSVIRASFASARKRNQRHLNCFFNGRTDNCTWRYWKKVPLEASWFSTINTDRCHF